MGMDASLPTGASVPTATQGPGSSGGGGGAVTRILQGAGISVAPGTGVGNVTVGNTGALTVSTTDERLSASPTSGAVVLAQSIVATWAIGSVRWYALDTTNGNDANAGFSDVSAAAAGAVPVKTAGRLNAILPVNGAGRSVVILIAAGTYPENTDFLTGRYGYMAFLCRGTATNATAGSVAFADSAADRIMCGAVTATGMNAAGYNPTGAATTTSIPCTLAGGGAPGFPAEPALPGGARLRFDSATATAALRNFVTTVITVAGGNTLTPLDTLPAVPSAADVFYLEMPGAIFNNIRTEGAAHASTQPAFFIAGLQNNGSVSGNRNVISNGIAIGYGFVWSNNPQTSQFIGNVSLVSFYELPSGNGVLSPIQTGGLCRFVGNIGFSSTRVGVAFGRGYYAAGQVTYERGGGFETSGFVAAGGLTTNDTPNTTGEYGDIDSIGTNASSVASGIARSRIIGTGTLPAGLMIYSGSFVLTGVDVTGAGAKPAIKFNAVGHALYFQTVVGGSTGNTDVGLDLSQAKGCEIVLAATPTVTGSNGDVRLSDGNVISWAQALGGVIDSAGNRLYAPGNNPLPQAELRCAALLVNDPVFTGGGTQAELPAGYTTALNAVAWRYNIGRYVSTIKLVYNVLANSLAGAGASFTINVLKNGVAVGSSAPIPSGSTPATQAIMILTSTLGASNRNTDVYSLQLQFTNVTPNVANTVELTAGIVMNGCY